VDTTNHDHYARRWRSICRAARSFQEAICNDVIIVSLKHVTPPAHDRPVGGGPFVRGLRIAQSDLAGAHDPFTRAVGQSLFDGNLCYVGRTRIKFCGGGSGSKNSGIESGTVTTPQSASKSGYDPDMDDTRVLKTRPRHSQWWADHFLRRNIQPQ
jgi:hypothetical protein